MCRTRFAKYGCYVVLFLLHLTAFTAAALAQQLSEERRAQLNEQAARLASRPSKIGLNIPQEIMQGNQFTVHATLLNAEGQPVVAERDSAYTVLFNPPSGGPQSQTIWIKKGQSAADFHLPADEAGLTSITIRGPDENVRSNKVEVIVQPAAKARQKASRSVRPAQLRQNHTNGQLRAARFDLIPANLIVGEHLDAGDPPASNLPVLHISVGDVGGNYVANGKDSAEISVIFETPDLSPAPVDIHAWFTWTRGTLDPPQPLTIKKGSFEAKTHLTSTSPSDVQFKFVSSTPEYASSGDTSFTIHFVPAGVALLGPDKLSVVDSAPIMVVFYDANMNPISPGRNWPVTLRCRQSKLRFNPQSFEVKQTSPIGSAVLFPVWFGSDTVEAVIANYKTEPVAVVVTGWLVLALCLAGGVAGGLAAWNRFKDSPFWRIFLGVLGAGVFCWLYVYLALPSIDINIAHNTFSVFFVALIGGFLGTTAIELAAKKFGLVS